jgi:hypothetical protein
MLRRFNSQQYSDLEGTELSLELQALYVPYTIRVEPYVTSRGEVFNLHYQYWLPGMEEEIGFDVNDDVGVLIPQEDVLTMLEVVKDIIDDPEQWPLHINDNDFRGDFVKERMRGLTTSEILYQYVQKRLGGKLPELPPFRIK